MVDVAKVARRLYLLQRVGPEMAVRDMAQPGRISDDMLAEIEDHAASLRDLQEELPPDQFERRLIQSEMIAMRKYAVDLIVRKNRGIAVLQELMLQRHRFERKLVNAKPGDEPQFQAALLSIETHLDDVRLVQVKHEEAVRAIKEQVKEFEEIVRAKLAAPTRPPDSE